MKDAKWFKAVVKTEKVFSNGISWICTAWFAAMILCMIWQVVSRFVLNISVPWTDEASRYLWITLCFIGAGAVINCAILDKNVVIKPNRELSGAETYPLYIGKDTTV